MALVELVSLAPVRAAQYLRMSTEHQKYSTENQSDAIAAYAARKNLTIVRTYIDEARSGIRFDGRHDLERLIGDVTLGRADFDCILVYALRDRLLHSARRIEREGEVTHGSQRNSTNSS